MRKRTPLSGTTAVSENLAPRRAPALTFTLALGVAAAVLLRPAVARADGSALPPEVGYNYGLTETPRTGAMAGALRAFSRSTDALFVNPANMVASRVYHVGALAQIWPQASRQSYGLAVVDSIVSASRLAGGIGGTWNRQDPSGVDRTFYDLRFALAYPFSDSFYLGASGRYLSLKQDGFPRGIYDLRPSSAAGGTPDKAIVQNLTFDAGATVKPAPEVAISVVGTNLTDPGHGFLPLTFGGGIAYGSDDFTLEADGVADFTTYGDTKARLMGGGEYLAADHFPLRIGYRYDQGVMSHLISGGLGYIDTAYEVDLSLQHVVSGEHSTAILFGFRYHVESSGLSPED